MLALQASRLQHSQATGQVTLPVADIVMVLFVQWPGDLIDHLPCGTINVCTETLTDCNALRCSDCKGEV